MRGSFPSPGLIRLSAEHQAIRSAILQVGGTPIIVGGLVRDALMGLPQTSDLDIEVHGLNSAAELVTTLGGASLRGGWNWTVILTGVSFGVLKVRLFSGDEVDISVPRRETKKGTGHKGFLVEHDPTMSFEEASGRRDFTINSMGWDPATKKVLDPWGGCPDLEKGILRHTTSAFTEDPLRVLRGVGFAARFGFTFAPETVALCASIKDRYHELAPERVWMEWWKILTKGTSISLALQALAETEWEEHFPQLQALHTRPDQWEAAGRRADWVASYADGYRWTGEIRAALILAALCWEMGGINASIFMQEIGAPKSIARTVHHIVEEAEDETHKEEPTPTEVRRLARRLEPVSIVEWAVVVSADKFGRGEGWIMVAEAEGCDLRPKLPMVTGNDLIEAGMKPGPTFKPILAEALEAQDNGEFASREEGLKWLTRRLESA